MQCEDLSLVAAHRAYIHLSLLHVPAIVARRNTLTMESFFAWPTPAHVLGLWDYRLRGGRTKPEASQSPPVEQVDQAPAEAADVTLTWDDVFVEVS